jgi:hypothetical protein
METSELGLYHLALFMHKIIIRLTIYNIYIGLFHAKWDYWNLRECAIFLARSMSIALLFLSNIINIPAVKSESPYQVMIY